MYWNFTRSIFVVFGFTENDSVSTQMAEHEMRSLVMVMFLIEFICSLIEKKSWYRLNDTITSFFMYFMENAPGFSITYVSVTCYGWIFHNFHIVHIKLSDPVSCLVLWFIVDFLFYWHHRAMHEMNFLWSYHKAHHSSEEMNFSVSMRQPVFQNVFMWLFYLPLALFVEPEMCFLHLSLNRFVTIFQHTRYFKNLGLLEYILTTPSHHRVHHARNPDCIDKNYGGVFIIWDRIFGTFTPESDIKGPIAYGIVAPVRTFDGVGFQISGFGEALQKFVSLPGPNNKLKSLIYGPGWSPGKPRLGDLKDIPEVKSTQPVHDVKLALWLKVYVVVHFVIFDMWFHPLSFHMTLKYGSYSRSETLGILVLETFIVLLNASVMGRVMDGSSWSGILECFRCSTCIVARKILPPPELVYDPTQTNNINKLVILLYVSILFWIFQIIYSLLCKKKDKYS